LIDEELNELEGRNKALGSSVLSHTVKATKGSMLEMFPIGKALRLIISRKNTLTSLYSA